MYLEVVRDIPAGGELLATPKVPIQIFKGPHDDRSDRETGENCQHIIFVFPFWYCSDDVHAMIRLFVFF